MAVYVLTLTPPSEHPRDFIAIHGLEAFARVYWYWDKRYEAMYSDLQRPSSNHEDINNRLPFLREWLSEYGKYKKDYWQWRLAKTPLAIAPE